MKNKRYRLSLLILFLISSPLVFAIPPYMGVSVGKELSFTSASCLAAGKTVLSNNGFQKIVQYKTNVTLFAAYRNQNPYHYKAMIKCLSDQGVIVVVAVANVPKHAMDKAENLQQQLQEQGKINRKVPVVEEEIVFSGEENEKVTSLPSKAKHRIKTLGTSKTVSERSRDTLLSRNLCLSRAEVSLRDSGFYQGLSFDDDSIWGENEKKYKATIRCLTANSLVLFQVRGDYKKTREKALNQLEKNF